MYRRINLTVGFAAVIGILAFGAVELRGGVITFDDLPGSGAAIPDGYAGFTWGSFNYLDGVNYAGNPSGYQTGVVSANNVAYNAWGNPAFMSDDPFTFQSAYFTAAWNDGLTITVDGYLDGSLVHTDTFTVNSTVPTFRAFGWGATDELRFHSSGGIDNPDYTGSGTHFAMDNFTYAVAGEFPAPEPASLAIWGTMGGLALMMKRRRKKRRQ